MCSAGCSGGPRHSRGSRSPVPRLALPGSRLPLPGASSRARQGQQGCPRLLPPAPLPARRSAVAAATGQDGAERPNGGSLPGQADFKPGTLLGGKYAVVELLGRGGNGVTYRCTNTADGSDVAVKCLSLRTLKDWKQLEMFEREAQILKNLDHRCGGGQENSWAHEPGRKMRCALPATVACRPTAAVVHLNPGDCWWCWWCCRGIPRYLDYFEQDTEQDRAFFLVQVCPCVSHLRLQSDSVRIPPAACQHAGQLSHPLPHQSAPPWPPGPSLRPSTPPACLPACLTPTLPAYPTCLLARPAGGGSGQVPGRHGGLRLEGRRGGGDPHRCGAAGGAGVSGQPQAARDPQVGCAALRCAGLPYGAQGEAAARLRRRRSPGSPS